MSFQAIYVLLSYRNHFLYHVLVVCVAGKSVRVEAIQVGDVLAVRAGEQCPVDGVVTKGRVSSTQDK